MNKLHVNAKMKNISFWLGERRMRIKQNLGISQKQVDLTERILKVREVIGQIPDGRSVLIYCDNSHIHYLFRYTQISKKNILGFLDMMENKMVYNSFENYQDYSVFSLENKEWRSADIILLCVFDDDSVKSALVEQGYSGEFISLYSEEDYMPFFCIPDEYKGDEEVTGNAFAEKIIKTMCVQPPSYYFSMIEHIDKINNILNRCGNKRILVYCVGGHTKCLFKFTDIKYKNVVAFADRDTRTFCGIEVRNTERESFEDVDYIVISSYIFQQEIEKYLIKLGLQDKIILLYDESDETSFYEMPNVCAPDRTLFGCSKNGMELADLYAELEASSNKLSNDSNYLITYNMLKNQIIDVGIMHNKSEPEIIKEKNYAAANRKVAIILQGPVVYEDDFTYRTICYYQKIFPEVKIILSTWKSETEKPEFTRFEMLPISLVTSEAPETKGILNINFQMKSTHAGLLRAKELGCEYVLKTRTDFRIYADDCLSYLCTLTEAFPSKGKAKKRITTLQPILDAAYYLPDFILFGDADDMLNFWDAEELFPNESGGLNPEMLMYIRYIKRLGCFVENPLENLTEYIDMLCREFIIVDPSTFKYFWKKYSYEGSIMYQESKNILTAADWFNRQYRSEKE